ncbi:bromodomain protein [Trypanosoma rangeli]|uniref:Bromodomain protein n=1 Tax=Trypanosoma rangeli TaxID=5698 RepID=A0A422NLU0_TRYRA|nr:bromodomain protein [Trypanosoma rangeli]RNF06468.1 bromodomain protein [Trypanosoma rangeli]|eukprot:RNF06468.1 bromodomain protein [Trypanosoma rangeli]
MGKREREGTLNRARCLDFVRQLWDKDELKMFHHPVSATELPDYHEVIQFPVDLSTIRRGVEAGTYDSDAEVQNAVAQMISNALEYNAKGTEWHRQALAFREVYLELAKQCGLKVDEDAVYIPSAAFKDDESTLRKAEEEHAENIGDLLKKLEEDKAVPLEELRAKYSAGHPNEHVNESSGSSSGGSSDSSSDSGSDSSSGSSEEEEESDVSSDHDDDS